MRAALDYLEATPLARIDIDHGYLANLTAHEKSEERRLLYQKVAKPIILSTDDLFD
jgi:hypothetical protein